MKGLWGCENAASAALVTQAGSSCVGTRHTCRSYSVDMSYANCFILYDRYVTHRHSVWPIRHAQTFCMTDTSRTDILYTRYVTHRHSVWPIRHAQTFCMTDTSRTDILYDRYVTHRHSVWQICHAQTTYRTSIIFLNSAALKRTSALCVGRVESSTWMRQTMLYQLHNVKCLTGTVAYGMIDKRILVTFNDTVSTVRLWGRMTMIMKCVDKISDGQFQETTSETADTFLLANTGKQRPPPHHIPAALCCTTLLKKPASHSGGH
jgi:hypothetical protein